MLAFVTVAFGCGATTLKPPEDPSAWDRSCSQVYDVGGVSWLGSCKNEIVHFICPVHRRYVVSLDSKSLTKAGIAKAQHHLYLKALRQAIFDWGKLMACRQFEVVLDHPYPDTNIAFKKIKYPGVLAYAYRAGNITFDAKRRWYPGSRSQGHWGPGHVYSFYWVVAHEMGHVWGMGHSDDIRSIMYPSQAAEGRWSWYERSATRIMYLVRWYSRRSRAFRVKRFFVKSPIDEVRRLLAQHR